MDWFVKPWRSPYDVCYNNPIFWIALNGDDDYFDGNGTFLGSDGSASTKIGIINNLLVEISNLYEKNGSISIKNGQANSIALSTFLADEKTERPCY